jgi:putative endonuclease
MSRQMRQPAVYIMANRRNGALYIGVTSNLPQRAYQHREGLTPGFTRRYGCKLLVYYERCEEMDAAIAREKQLKNGSRQRKLALIEKLNPDWRDLYGDFA